MRQREDLLELIEDQQWDERRACLVLQHVIAMMQVFPERLTLTRNACLRPLARVACGAADGLFDLFSGLWRIMAVVDAYVNRAIPLSA